MFFEIAGRLPANDIICCADDMSMAPRGLARCGALALQGAAVRQHRHGWCTAAR